MTNNSNGKKPKIALLHYSGPPVISGVELFIKDQARLFRFFNYKVELVVGIGKNFRKDIPLHVINKMDSANPDVLKVRAQLENKIVSDKFYSIEISLYNKLYKYFTENQIDICIAHNLITRHYNLPLTSALVRLSKDLPNIKFISWVHDLTFADYSYSKIQNNLSKEFPWKFLTTSIDNWDYVCISEFREKQLLKIFNKIPKKLMVIPNGIDVDKFLGLSAPMRKFYNHIDGQHSDLIVCIPVRIVKRKNLELGIKIAYELLKMGINIKLIITGNADHHQAQNHEYYTQLKKLVEELGLGNNVFFLAEYFKKISNGEVIKPSALNITEVYQISDILLMTSSIEGFGLPLLEAGLTRTPIFASDIEPFHEIGQTNINYFSLDDEPGEIASFILNRIKEMPQAYFYRKVINKYAFKHIFKKYVLPYIDSLHLEGFGRFNQR